MEIVKFGEKDIENILSKMDDQEIDELAFGAIKVDSGGKILVYNETEAELTGRKAEDVIGKNFFDEVAPCTKRPDFYGVFREGVQKGELNTLFEYVFDYKMKPVKVKVHMKKALTGDDYWIFVKRIEFTV